MFDGKNFPTIFGSFEKFSQSLSRHFHTNVAVRIVSVGNIARGAEAKADQGHMTPNSKQKQQRTNKQKIGK